jgi:hypothetical protein
MDTCKVDIYILTKLPEDQIGPRVSPLFYLLSRQPWMEEKFPGLIVNGHNENGVPTFISTQDQENKCDPDRKAMELIINESHSRDCNNHILVVKDTSITCSSAEHIFWTIYNFLREVTTDSKRHQYHLLYLAKWLDRCDLYTTQDPILVHPDNHLKIFKTTSPYGLQAILMTSQGARLIKEDLAFNKHPEVPVSIELTQWIGKGKLRAATTFPELMTFDITRAENDIDIVKTASCRQAPIINKPTTKSGNKALFWFIIILIGVIILAAALIKIGPMSPPKTIQEAYYSDPQSGIAIRM